MFAITLPSLIYLTAVFIVCDVIVLQSFCVYPGFMRYTQSLSFRSISHVTDVFTNSVYILVTVPSLVMHFYCANLVTLTNVFTLTSI